MPSDALARLRELEQQASHEYSDTCQENRNARGFCEACVRVPLAQVQLAVIYQAIARPALEALAPFAMKYPSDKRRRDNENVTFIASMGEVRAAQEALALARRTIEEVLGQ